MPKDEKRHLRTALNERAFHRLTTSFSSKLKRRERQRTSKTSADGAY